MNNKQITLLYSSCSLREDQLVGVVISTKTSSEDVKKCFEQATKEYPDYPLAEVKFPSDCEYYHIWCEDFNDLDVDELTFINRGIF